MLEKINSFVWGNGLVFLLLATGIIVTVKFGAVQLKLPYLLIKNGKSQNTGISQLKTVCMSLGTTMGTGNIIGAASALAIGGAGSIFWMWVSAFLGMGIVYAENLLSAKYSGGGLKGPMAYLERGLGCPKIAWIFALFCVLASFGMGGMVQVNTFSEALGDCVEFSKPVAAIIIFAVILSVIRGGAMRIGTAAQYLLPLASAAYGVVCVWVILVYRESLGDVFGRIFKEAFNFKAAEGGVFGCAVSVGLRRGIFSNEAGLGSSPILHSAAEGTSSEAQGAWSMFEVFFDTMLCCTLTAVTVMCGSESFSPTEAVSVVLGKYASIFITAELGLFAFCTVIGWYYCGMTAFSHLTKGRYIGKFAVIYSAAAASGALFAAKEIWTLSDIFNGLMAFPNLLGILLLINCKDNDIFVIKRTRF